MTEEATAPAPDTTAPNTNAPDTTAPDTTAPDTSLPDLELPDTESKVKVEKEAVDSKIDPTLYTLAVKIDSVQYHPQNPRMGDVDVIAQSLDRFGQIKPIVVQNSTGYIVAGNHTHKAAKQLGWEFIAVVRPDLSDEEALAFVVADNRTSDLGDYDNAILGPILEGLMLTGKLAGTGYTPDEVDDMLALLDALPEVDVASEATYGSDGEELAKVFGNRTNEGAQRQFVLLYQHDVAAEVEENCKTLLKAWGVEGMRDVVAEALRRCLKAEEK